MAITTFRRYEKKFYITKKQRDALLPAVFEHMDPDPYCLDGKSYNLVNLYFDDDENTVVLNSILKPHYKEKLRLRSYGAPESDDTTVYLEIKSKLYGIVAKRRVGMRFGDAMEYIRSGKRPKTDLYMQKQVLDEIDEFRRRTPCEPKLVISYDRQAYFQRGNRSIRLTFDDNIVTNRDQLDISKFRTGEPLIPGDRVILEIKVPDTLPLWLSKALSDEGIFITSFSKYGKEFQKNTPHD